MSDLISRQALLDRLKGNVLIDVTTELEKEVINQPTAFDVDKVVEQIEDYREEAGDLITDIIDLVRGGGIDG